MMRSPRRLAATVALAVLVAAGVIAQEPPLRRFGLFIGANDGGDERVTLRWAVTDAQRVAGVMSELGGIQPRDSYLLEDPTVDQLSRQLQRISDRISEAEDSSRRTEFVLYYSGHSDEGGLMLREDHFTYLDLRRAIESVDADVNIAILDSCASGAFTRLKGGAFIQPFLPDDGSEMTGHAFLTSSSADEASQESDSIGSSFFTHYLVSGLRGAADADRDGLVTLDEAYAHARDATLGRTATTFAGPQHASFDFQLSGTGSLVLTNLKTVNSGVRLAVNVSGTLFVHDTAGALVAEVNKSAGSELTVALPDDRYVVTLKGETRDYQHEVTLEPGTATLIEAKDFREVFAERNRVRGDGQPTTAALSFSVFPGMTFGVTNADITTISFGLLTAQAYRVEGFQLSAVVALAGEDLIGGQITGVGGHVAGDITGAQIAGVYNTVGGDSRAFQTAGVFNQVSGVANVYQSAGVFNVAAGGMNGVQTAGVFNQTYGAVNGVQIAGVYNQAGPIRGAQISLVNIAGNVNGAQIGLVNVGGTVNGTQIGLVNISQDMYGVPIGIVNMVENGIHNVSLWWQEDERAWIGVQNGSNFFYTLVYGGTSMADDGWRELAELSVGAGFGVRVQFRPLFVDADISYTRVSDGTDPQSSIVGLFDAARGATFPSARLLGGIALGDGLGWYFGASFDIESAAGFDAMGYFAGLAEGFAIGSENVRAYPRFFTGFKL